MPDDTFDPGSIEKVHSDMAEKLDRIFLDILENGQEVFDQKASEVVRIEHPTASMICQIRMRLRDLGINNDPANSDTMRKLINMANQKKVLELPDLPSPDDEPDSLVG